MVEFVLGLFAVGMVLALPLVALVLSLVNAKRLRELTRGLEAQRRELERLQSTAQAPAAPTIRVEPPAARVEAPLPIPATAPVAAGEPVAPAPGRAAAELHLGPRLAAWIGAVALFLAGAFFVKFSFEQGWLGPASRVTLGLVFGSVLVASGEWMHRRSAAVAQGLAAAGIAVLFAALLAGVTLYHLLSPASGFALLAVTTAAAIFLSLRHGPFVALLGLVGGLITPLLIRVEEPNPWWLCVYLLLLHTTLLLVSGKRKWWPISALAAAGSLGWGILAMARLDSIGGQTTPIGLFLLATAAITLLVVGRQSVWDDSRVAAAFVWCGAGATTILLASLVGVSDYSLVEWTFWGLLGAGCLVLARLDERYTGLPWLASLVGATTLVVWGTELEPASAARFWGVALCLGLLYAASAWGLMWGSRNMQSWAALSVASGLGYLLAAYSGLARTPYPLSWGLQSLSLGALFFVMARPLARRRSDVAGAEAALGAFAVGITACVSLAAALELERASISVAWAVSIAVLAWIRRRLPLGVLEKLAYYLAAGVTARLLLNPAVLFYPTGTARIFNWMAWGYGVPILAFAVAAHSFRRSASERLAEALSGGAIAFGFALISLEIRQAFHPGRLGAPGFTLGERAALTIAWLLYGLVLLFAHDLAGRRVLRLSGIAVVLAGLAEAALGLGLLANPLFFSHPVGSAVLFNKLPLVYGLPAIAAAILAFWTRRLAPAVLSHVCGGVALGLVFLLVTLSVRQGFHGSLLNSGRATSAEMYTYSLAWITLATLLLVAAILSRAAVLRYGSAVVMLLAVGKVFLVDTANLRDLYRVLSLLGLGVSLMLLAFLYQKFVFGEKAEARPAGDTAGGPK